MRTRYFKSMKDLTFFLNRLKMELCPHCKKAQSLNKHGPIKGNSEKSNVNDATRGHRIFCSNRHKRQGCGRTFQLLISDFISQYSITTASLWRLITLSVLGMHTYNIATCMTFSLSTLYRIIKTFSLRQSKIRTFLRVIRPPTDLNCTTPFQQTVNHLKTCFPGSRNPILDFQCRFQTAIL